MAETRPGRQGAGLLIAALFAVLGDAVSGGVYGSSAGYIQGTLLASPDEASWYNLCYLIAKVAGFPLVAWCCSRWGATVVLRASLVLTLAGSLSGLLADDYAQHLISRLLQGAAGAGTLVGAQTLLFDRFSRQRQGMTQAALATATVVIPMGVLPALTGWLGAAQHWQLSFALGVPFTVLALALLATMSPRSVPAHPRRALDPVGMVLLSGGLGLAVYVLVRGPRYDWFDAPHIVWLSGLAGIALLLSAVWHLSRRPSRRFLDIAVFTNPNFFFGFTVSHLAGYILFGSGFIIPVFAGHVLGFTSADSGRLILPSSLLTLCSLLLAGALIQYRRLDPIRLVPFGLGLMVWALWMLAHGSSDSGFGSLLLPVLIRGFAMGLLFMAVTIVAMNHLSDAHRPWGVALFNLGRQMGGIIGLSVLNTLFDQQRALIRNRLIEHLSNGDLRFEERLSQLGSTLSQQGVSDSLLAPLSANLLSQSLKQQVATLASNTAFLSLIGLVLCALPVVLKLKLIQKKTGWSSTLS